MESINPTPSKPKTLKDLQNDYLGIAVQIQNIPDDISQLGKPEQEEIHANLKRLADEARAVKQKILEAGGAPGENNPSPHVVLDKYKTEIIR